MQVDLNLLAKIVGNNMNTRVVTGNNFAIGKDKNGLIITIPPLADGDEDEAINLRAGLCHEAVGHGRFTDFEAKRGPTPLHLSMENVLEDARIEKCAWKVYPGARRILSDGMVVLVKQNKIRRAGTEDSPAEKAAIAILLRLMVEELSYSCGINWRDDWAIAVSFFGDEVLNRVWILAVAGYQTESTGDVIAYAAKIVDLLKTDTSSEPKPQKQEEKQQDKQPEQPPESGSGKYPKDEQSGQSSEVGSGGMPEDGQPSDGESGGKGDTPSGQKTTQARDLGSINPEEFDRGNALSKSVNNMRQTPISTVNMQIIDERHKNLTKFIESPDAKVASQRLKSRLMQKLISIVDDEDDGLTDCGSLSGTHLVGAALGDQYVFTEPGTPGEGLDIAISFLIDMSGSMKKRSRDVDCLSATWAINNVLNGYSTQGVRFSISSFNSNLHLLKNWENPWKSGNCLSNYFASGSTFTAPAIRNRLEDLLLVKNSRKVLFLITDGHTDEINSLFRAAKEMDVEIVVMMIGVEASMSQTYSIELRNLLPDAKRISVVPEGQVASATMKAVLDLF